MEYKAIKNILEKYFAGQSSLQEEATLRAYFQEEDIDPELEVYRPLFQFFAEEGEQTTSGNFNQRWTGPPAKEARVRALRPIVRWASIAALIALTIGSWWWMQQDIEPEQPQTAAIDWSKFEPQNEEEALRLTKEALLRTSIGLNTGAREAATQLKKVNRLADPLK